MLILTFNQPQTKDRDLAQRVREIIGNDRAITVVEATEGFSREDAETADSCVVIGSYEACAEISEMDVALEAPLANVMSFLSMTEIPVLAVGFGFELLCATQGIDLESYGERGIGAGRIEPVSDGQKLFQGSDPLRVAENIRWQTDEFPKKLQALARSQTGVEAVRHKSKMQIGLQQCPEDFLYPSDAKMIYENIFSLFDQFNAKRA